MWGSKSSSFRSILYLYTWLMIDGEEQKGLKRMIFIDIKVFLFFLAFPFSFLNFFVYIFIWLLAFASSHLPAFSGEWKKLTLTYYHDSTSYYAMPTMHLMRSAIIPNVIDPLLMNSQNLCPQLIVRNLKWEMKMKCVKSYLTINQFWCL